MLLAIVLGEASLNFFFVLMLARTMDTGEVQVPEGSYIPLD